MENLIIMDKMKKLVDILNYHTRLYDEGHPEWSDKEWDEKYFELVKLEEQFKKALPNSPTQKVSWDAVSKLVKVQHNHPMLSLDKTKDENDIISFVGKEDCIAMLKMDGLTCSLRYVDGRLVSAETRGNGVEGEDILHNARIIHNIPQAISYREELIIDGEIICDLETFENFRDDFANARNFAAGKIRTLDPHDCAKGNLSFIAWDVIKGFDNEKRLSDKLFDLENKLNIDTVPFVTWDGAFDFEEISKVLKESAKDYHYPIDGLVFKYDDIEKYQSMGKTEHHFKGGLAFKFYDEEYETELLKIDYDVSRMGVLTPVAVFKPIEIDGTIVERASLHNLSIMYDLLGQHPDLYQPIKIIKANQIIPQVVSAEYKNDQPHDHIIFDVMNCRCPICGTIAEVSISDSGVKNLICPNENCEGKLANRIDHYCNRKKGMDIRGLSRVTIEKLIDWGWVSSILDLYNLSAHKSEWQNKPGFGAKSVDNILTAIEVSKHADLAQFISSLGIPLIGTTASKELAKIFNSYQEFRDYIDTDDCWFDEFDGFGPEMNDALKNFDYTEADKIAAMLTFNEVKEEEKNASVEGMTFVITGKLSKKRDDIKKDIENHGGKVTGSVSSKTNYLVCNDKNSTTGKSADAKKLNIPIITEEELMMLLDKVVK